MNAAEIEQAVREDASVTYWISQCRVGCGFGEDGERTVDLWGISVKRPYFRMSVEIKVSRGDYLRDLAKPLKQRRARLMANQFYFAAPVGMLSAVDLPPWAGLLEVSDRSQVSVPAPWFDSAPPTWSFIASLIRRFEKAVYEPSENVLDACEKVLANLPLQQSRPDEFRRYVTKARRVIADARKPK